jgi:hypothetical protein
VEPPSTFNSQKDIARDGTWFENKDLRIVFDPNGIGKDVIFAASRKSAKSGNHGADPGL